MSDAISFGGGVNSVALTVLLVSEGWRGPIVMAETGCEWPETYSYVEGFEKNWLEPRGLHLTRVGARWRFPSCSGTLEEYSLKYGILPACHFRWCTSKYKVIPLNRWAKANGIDTLHLGIASDEAHRSKDKSRPLCERHITRADCIDILASKGLPIPMKSGCWCCGLQPFSRWRQLYEKHPDLYERAIRMEDHSTRARKIYATFDPKGIYTLHDLKARFAQQNRLLDDAQWDALSSVSEDPWGETPV